MANQENLTHLGAIESLSTDEIKASVQAIIDGHSDGNTHLTSQDQALILALVDRNDQFLSAIAAKLEISDELYPSL